MVLDAGIVEVAFILIQPAILRAPLSLELQEWGFLPLVQ